MLRRVNNEIADLKLKYPNIEFNLIKISDKEYNLEFNFQGNKLNIILDPCYPFKPPGLLVNEKDFFEIVRKSDSTMIKKIYGFDCFCCQSYLCSKNWSPSIRLDDIIDQSLDLINKKMILDNINSDETQACSSGSGSGSGSGSDSGSETKACIAGSETQACIAGSETQACIAGSETQACIAGPNNYVPGRFIITNSSNTNSSDTTKNMEIDNTDSNYSLLKELYTANEQDDLIKYQELYNNFINDPDVYCWHSYTDHPAGPVKRQFYSLCSCSNTNINVALVDPEDFLIKIHRGLYESGCNCKAGKRYFALRNAYEIQYKKVSDEPGSFITFSIKDLINRTDNLIISQIIDWIELDGPIDKSYVEWI